MTKEIETRQSQFPNAQKIPAVLLESEYFFSGNFTEEHNAFMEAKSLDELRTLSRLRPKHWDWRGNEMRIRCLTAIIYGHPTISIDDLMDIALNGLGIFYGHLFLVSAATGRIDILRALAKKYEIRQIDPEEFILTIDTLQAIAKSQIDPNEISTLIESLKVIAKSKIDLRAIADTRVELQKIAKKYENSQIDLTAITTTIDRLTEIQDNNSTLTELITATVHNKLSAFTCACLNNQLDSAQFIWGLADSNQKIFMLEDDLYRVFWEACANDNLELAQKIWNIVPMYGIEGSEIYIPFRTKETTKLNALVKQYEMLRGYNYEAFYRCMKLETAQWLWKIADELQQAFLQIKPDFSELITKADPGFLVNIQQTMLRSNWVYFAFRKACQDNNIKKAEWIWSLASSEEIQIKMINGKGEEKFCDWILENLNTPLVQGLLVMPNFTIALEKAMNSGNNNVKTSSSNRYGKFNYVIGNQQTQPMLSTAPGPHL